MYDLLYKMITPNVIYPLVSSDMARIPEVKGGCQWKTIYK